MKQLADKLKVYIPGQPDLKIVEDEDIAEMGQVVHAQTDFVYGYVEYTEDDKLSSFQMDLLDEEEPPEMKDARESALDIEELLKVAKQFADDFCPRDVTFNVMIEWEDDEYFVVYEERDEQLNLSIPNTGCSITIDRWGYIKGATVAQENYELTYPEITITPEQAKERICREELLQLGIHIEGERAELIYHPNHNLMSVNVNGEIEWATDFMQIEQPVIEPIRPIEVAYSIEAMLGITADLTKEESDGITYWREAGMDNSAEEMERYAEVDKSDSASERYESNAPWERAAAPLAAEVLQEKAMQFLEAAAGNIDEKYWLEQAEVLADEELEDEVDEEFFEDEEDEWAELEPVASYTFIRQYKGMRLDEYSAVIHVGEYSGLIRYCDIPLVNEAVLSELKITPNISYEEAVKLYTEQFRMQLVRSVNDIEDRSTYGLSYLMDFPGPNGHIEKINALTGEITYVETGIVREA